MDELDQMMWTCGPESLDEKMQVKLVFLQVGTCMTRRGTQLSARVGSNDVQFCL